MIKHQSLQNDLSSADRPLEEDENQTIEHGKMTKNNKNKRRGSSSLRVLYEKLHQAAEKARLERDALIKTKEEEREKDKAVERLKGIKRLRRRRQSMDSLL